MKEIIIAIDPGKAGGIAHMERGGDIQAVAMPKTPVDTVDYLRQFNVDCRVLFVYIEQPGTWVASGKAGPSVDSIVKLNIQMAEMRGACMAMRYPVKMVTPRQWMTHFGSVPTGQSADAKRARKEHIKGIVQEQCPDLKVTLKTADALGILLSVTTGWRMSHDV